MSDMYGGAASNHQIMKTLYRKKLPRDTIMVDKGFNIEDVLIPHQITMNIPSFFKKENKIDSEIVLKDRKVASKTVHVERHIVIGRTFKIL